MSHTFSTAAWCYVPGMCDPWARTGPGEWISVRETLLLEAPICGSHSLHLLPGPSC